MLSYKLQKNSFGEVTSVQIVGNPLTSIPLDLANTDYQAYLAWLEAGNTPEPADTIDEEQS